MKRLLSTSFAVIILIVNIAIISIVAYADSSTSVTSLVINPDGTPTNSNPGISAESISGIVSPINSPLSLDSALSLALTYDSEGFYILNDCLNHGTDLSIFLSGNSNAESLETMVHEGFHSFTYQNGSLHRLSGLYTNAYYIGNGQIVYVPESYIFKTEEWASSIPGHLKTLRYDTYVSPGSEPTSNTRGIYGLLNEFVAYYWGMNNQMQLFDYYKSQPFDLNSWGAFTTACENDILAFYEFRFYILGYLNYAETAHPDIWQEILANQGFVNTYSAIEKRFESLITDYELRKGEITDIGSSLGKNVKFSDGMIFIDGHGRGIGADNVNGREQLITEIKSEAFQKQENLIFSRSQA